MLWTSLLNHGLVMPLYQEWLREKLIQAHLHVGAEEVVLVEVEEQLWANPLAMISAIC